MSARPVELREVRVAYLVLSSVERGAEEARWGAELSCGHSCSFELPLAMVQELPARPRARRFPAVLVPPEAVRCFDCDPLAPDEEPADVRPRSWPGPRAAKGGGR